MAPVGGGRRAPARSHTVSEGEQTTAATGSGEPTTPTIVSDGERTIAAIGSRGEPEPRTRRPEAEDG
jgi:hypothetical protein